MNSGHNSKQNINFKDEFQSNNNLTSFENLNDSSIDNLLLDKPVISLIIPVYQEEKILEDILSKYDKQILSKFNVEMIVSDGGSSDNTIEIARKYADILVLNDSGIRQTIAEGRNCGVKYSSGDVLVFINGDTYPKDLNLFFSIIYDWAKDNHEFSNCPAIACPVDVAPELKLFKDSVFYFLHNLYIRLLNSIGFGMGRGECQIVKRNYFMEVKGYNPKIAAGEDFDLYRRLAKIGKIGYESKLKVFESPRRFRKYGYIRILFSWIINSISVMFFNKSLSKEWEAVR